MSAVFAEQFGEKGLFYEIGIQNMWYNTVYQYPTQHDSVSAAYAVPAKEEEYLFINSGTWSVLGTVLDEPIIVNTVENK